MTAGGPEDCALSQACSSLGASEPWEFVKRFAEHNGRLPEELIARAEQIESTIRSANKTAAASANR
ncbi:MAG TPA: hypothetical protein VK680_13905 [Solirubrobacteraceae bacterium]|jgi:hypothetical protein|nr:hypothetical protein [Solirubrobacteraceae bacterium]